jgi:glycosyltransferase involved in cell wall biosynthesis
MTEQAAKRRRKILIFAYFFPPIGGAGVQRTVKFAKYLPDEGWDPTIVTVHSRAYWMADPSLAQELGPRVSVLRTKSLTGLSLLRSIAPKQAGSPGQMRTSSAGIRRLRRLASWVLLPDSYRGWVPFAVRAAERLLRRERFDLILTTSSPDSAHLIGLALSRRWGIPWIADFRDPWTRRLSFDPPTVWHRRWHEKMEQAVLEAAALVTVTAEETRRDYLRRFPKLGAEKVQVVTNGFDEEDFSSLTGIEPSGERMQVLHAGQLNPDRPARPFLEGLRRFLVREERARRRMQVLFVGPFYKRDLDDARRMGLGDVVRFEPGRSHREIVAELLRSHLLLLMEQDSERGALILPAKIFEYVRARRPILGLLPEGAAWNLIARLGAGWCCRTGDAECCARTLGTSFAAFERRDPARTEILDETLAAFERRALTHRLAGFLDARIGACT